MLAVDDAPTRLEVVVGKTLETDVGYAIGFHCDDVTVVEAQMKTKDEATNVFVVKGLKEGTTLCRVGTDPSRSSTLYKIRVVAPPVIARPRR